MTKPLHPEIKAMAAMLRALQPLDEDQSHRSVTWLVARLAGISSVYLPSFPKRPRETA